MLNHSGVPLPSPPHAWQEQSNVMVSSCLVNYGMHLHRVLTRVSGSMLVQHNTTPVKGADVSTRETVACESMVAIVTYFIEVRL